MNAPKTLYSVQQGNSVQLICTWSGTPGATSVLWKKYVQGTPTDINVATSNGKYAGSSVDSPSLTINNVNHDDVATYVCSASNAEGTSNSQPINLQVTGGKQGSFISLFIFNFTVYNTFTIFYRNTAMMYFSR